MHTEGKRDMTGMRRRATAPVVAAFIAGLMCFGVSPGLSHADGACVNVGGAGGCYATIQAAVNAVSGGTITVAAGTYAENVSITKPVSLQGAGAATTIIDATSSKPAEGIRVNGVNTPMVISGFTVENAPNEGILVQDSSHVTIENNTVQNNDKALIPNPNPFLATCAGALPFDQEDCGEGVHLLGTSFSTVSHNLIQNNAGGILLTDETGPTHDNVISGNTVQNNILDCGITLPSHPSGFGPPATPGGPPTFLPGHGVYRNLIIDNTSTGNGGAGVGIFAPTPGTASYDNTVEGNTLSGNGNAGVSMHSHAPDQNLSGNKIINNTIGTNNLFGDADAGDTATTGILILGVVVPVANTLIAHNTITGNQIGIWLANTTHTVLAGNRNSSSTPISFASAPQALTKNPTGPSMVAMSAAGSEGLSGSFTVNFSSTQAGQGEVYFGSGPGCTGLVEVGTGDLGTGTTHHTVVVTGNDMPGTIGNSGIQPGATYFYEMVTTTSSGTVVDNNNGACYSVTIPAK